MKKFFKNISEGFVSFFRGFDKKVTFAIILVVGAAAWVAAYFISTPFHEMSARETWIADSLALVKKLEAEKDSAKADSIRSIMAERQYILDSLERVKDIENGRNYYKVDKYYYTIQADTDTAAAVVDTLKTVSNE